MAPFLHLLEAGRISALARMRGRSRQRRKPLLSLLNGADRLANYDEEWDYYEERDDEARIILKEGASLDDLPATHRSVLTPDVRAAFADPRAYFRDVSDRAPLRSFGTWIRALTEGTWQLVVFHYKHGSYADSCRFRWRRRGVSEGTFQVGRYDETESVGHPDFRLIYSVVREVRWRPPPMSGDLLSPHERYLVAGCCWDEEVRGWPSDTTTIFAHTECGDMLIHTPEGKAGFLSHETKIAYPTGTIPETLDCIFGLLLTDETPQFDDDRAEG